MTSVPLELFDALSLRVRHHEMARASGDLWLEERNLTELCSVIEVLLGAHLRASDDWDTTSWVQAVLPVTMEISDSGVAVLSGRVVWRSGRGWFLDPLSARLELSSTGASLREYTIGFGDADAGLGSLTYEPGAHAADEMPRRTDRWRYVFVNRVG